MFVSSDPKGDLFEIEDESDVTVPVWDTDPDQGQPSSEGFKTGELWRLVGGKERDGARVEHLQGVVDSLQAKYDKLMEEGTRQEREAAAEDLVQARFDLEMTVSETKFKNVDIDASQKKLDLWEEDAKFQVQQLKDQGRPLRAEELQAQLDLVPFHRDEIERERSRRNMEQTLRDSGLSWAQKEAGLRVDRERRDTLKQLQESNAEPSKVQKAQWELSQPIESSPNFAKYVSTLATEYATNNRKAIATRYMAASGQALVSGSTPQEVLTEEQRAGQIAEMYRYVRETANRPNTDLSGGGFPGWSKEKATAASMAERMAAEGV